MEENFNQDNGRTIMMAPFFLQIKVENHGSISPASWDCFLQSITADIFYGSAVIGLNIYHQDMHITDKLVYIIPTAHTMRLKQ